VFSYEQAFMGDLVRFWYAALFLFASAYTLLEEGHVRVDVMYAGFTEKKKGLINAVGSIFLGATLCMVILVLGMEGKANIINAPLLSYEVSQSGFGMYVKYMMAGFLAIFAISMLIQFAASFLSGIADYRGEPGGRKIDDVLTH
jgi:TRAP-type mannitol/chloroaromatic compound transport system permease small subunit